MTISSFRIETWGDKFIVVCELRRYTYIRLPFDTYAEAIQEVAKIAAREKIRYESGFDSDLGR